MTAILKMTNQQLDHLAANLFDCGFGVSAQQVQSMVVEIQDSRKALEAAQQRIAELERERDTMQAAALAMRDDMRDAREAHDANTAELVAAGIITKVGE